MKNNGQNSEKILHNLDLDEYISSLNEKEQIDFMFYVIDTSYIYEEDDKKDEEKNKEILDFLRKYRDLQDKCLELVKDEPVDDDYYDVNYDEVKYLITQYKKKRENKLERILKLKANEN